jgi:predicted MFS family arabinose efflux permease
MGFLNISATILIPFAANLARPEERGKVVGTVLSGILLGSLMARTIAGFMSDTWGWQSVFLFSGAINLTLAAATQWALPVSAPSFHGSYKDLLKSLWHLVKEYPTVREAALMGGLLFGSFSAFWTTLTFLLEGAPFNYAAKTIGLFGLLGMMGALAAPLVGRYADKKGPSAAIRLGIYLTLAAFALLGLSSVWVAGVIVGVILLDLGIQVAHISNQTRLFEVSAEARSRLSSIYIFAYFTGGSLGSFIGSQLWSWGRWPAVSAGGFVLCLGAGILFFRGEKGRTNIASH